ncbi:putative phage abortive infection protein [Bacillus subtilis]|uniref:putative phage abortive infection protein n=1 Tax=Bacillus inaquosorum TaxID=483913 RepID=UPI0002DFC042|nr:putative phage abortive infection protein [Bacillus inaquosorum]MED4649915.1 putative phage abortive infection protein [Bacillus inaquosorum]MED4793348.1 putative phage abortive infection protein [Bacillus inaquosorum]
MSENNKKEKWYDNENIFMYAGLTICMVAVITPFLILLFAKDVNFNNLGPVGDFFGGTTVGLFNLASILLVLTTVKMQGKELRETRTEFETTNKTLIKQQFDNTFFNMINLHNEIVKGLKIADYEGKYALSYLNLRIKHQYSTPEMMNIESEKTRLLLIYEDFYEQYYFGHYFRNMYRIMKFIDQQDKELTTHEKKNYIGILRAQLSTGELLLIFYNALSDRGEKFRKLILKYNFFDDLLDDEGIYQELRCELKS